MFYHDPSSMRGERVDQQLLIQINLCIDHLSAVAVRIATNGHVTSHIQTTRQVAKLVTKCRFVVNASGMYSLKQKTIKCASSRDKI
jgi:hypothetical protein